MTPWPRGAALARGGAMLALAFLPGRALALDPARAISQYVQSVWRVEEGLTHNTVRAIRQTRDGYMWLGTYGGLARFDGVRFKVFDNRNSALTSNEIRALHEDARGVLWVGTTAGGLYRVENGNLVKDETAIESRTINAILATREGALLVGTGNGLYEVRGKEVRRFTVDEGLWANGVTALIEGGGGRVLIGTEEGVNILSNGAISKGPRPDHPLKLVNGLLLDHAGNLYVTGRKVERFAPSGELTLSLDVPGIGAFSPYEDANGSIWFGTYGSGIARLENDVMKTYGPEEGFPDRRVWSVTEDREGALWIGTRGGLVQLRDGAAVSYSTTEGFAGNVGRSVFEDRDGALYFGFEGGISRLAKGRVDNITTKDGLPDPIVKTVMRDSRGRLWVGTQGGVAVETSPKHFRVWGQKEGTPRQPKLVYEDRQGRIWSGGDVGLALFENDRFVAPTGTTAVQNSSIEVLYQTLDGWLWIGTLTHGAWRLKDGRLEAVPLLGLTAIGVRSFRETSRGVFMVGTVGSGLFLKSPGKEFRQLTTRNGLGDDSIWSILDDGRGQTWFTSDRGVFRVATADLEAFAESRIQQVEMGVVVGRASGLKSRECNGGGNPAGFITRDGRILAPTFAGVAIIDPMRLAAKTPPPPVQIEEVVIDGEEAARGAEAVFASGARDAEIHYTGLSFVNPSRTHFRYRLLGHDPAWVDAGTRRIAYYGGLSPGRYSFRVAASSDGVAWTPQEAGLEVVVEPLWYQTWLVRALFAALAVGLVASAFGWRVRRLRARERELAGLVASRTEELAQRSRELEAANLALSHLAITDDLTGIANHRQFREFIEREWLRCARAHEPISLLMCDIDEFKAYNDALGHQKGDECLRAVAQTMAEAVKRAPDLAARYGGEEFAVVLPATNREGGSAVAESIRTALAARAIPHPRSSAATHVTMSIGLATALPSASNSLEDLIAAADQALYAAKSAGRDRLVAGQRVTGASRRT
jgi:diguanylate cyclase (GGDEF)-like protein